VRPIRVAHIIEHLGRGGGAEQVVVNILRHLDRRRFEPCVAMLAREFPEHDLSGIEVLNDSNPRCWAGLRGRLRLWKALRRRGTDIVHSHARTGDKILLALAGPGSSKVVLTRHNATPGRMRTGLGVRLADLAVDAWVGVSPSVSDFIRSVGVPAAKVATIPNGIDVGRFGEIPEEVGPRVRAELGLRGDEFMCLAVGALRREKSYPMMIRCVAAARRSEPRLRLFIAGGGHGEAEVRRAIRETGQQDAVRLLGRRSDVPALLKACDLYLSSSLYEGLPLAVCEAMAASRPVVGTLVAGVRDVVIDGQTGYLLPVEDEEGYARAILELAADPELRARMGAAGRARARERFSVQAMVRSYEQLYLTLVRRVHARPETGPI